jgi:hypothetical protein
MLRFFRFASTGTFLVAVALLMLHSLPVQAQTDGSSDGSLSASDQAALTSAQDTQTPPLTVDVSPQYPTPYSSVTITPNSTVFDIAGATISVKVNGTSFYKGSGSTGIVVPLGGPGSSTRISVSATSGGQTYTQEITLRPADVALVEEPISTTHPFYAGAALVPSEGQVRLIAIPDIRSSASTAINPSQLVYTWSLGDQVLDSDSGLGKNVLDAQAPQEYRDATVSVTVTSQDGSLEAQAQTTVSPVDPIARIYVDDPLLGPLYDNALSNSYTMPDVEDTFLGVPYYFPGSATSDWNMNGSDSGSNPDLTVRDTGTGSGTATISFTASDPSSNETANSTLSVMFGSQNSTGLFGL